MKQLVVDAGSRARGETEDGTGREESRKESKKKVEAEFGCAAQKIVTQKTVPGPHGDHPNGDALKVPQ